MPVRTWGRRAVVAGCAAAIGLAALTPVAWAESTDSTTPGYAPITLTPEESQRLCAEVLPRLTERADRLTERIQGGADVKGSAAWLRERARQQREKGHPKVAERLEQRAERRAGRLDDLQRITQRLNDFRTRHCQVVEGTR
ncbi:MAG TPA: hypothetical protein VIL00_12965 [Pseudonocardiaceae bacterium]